MTEGDSLVEWERIPRKEYSKMTSRHRPFWQSLNAFIRSNNVSSIVEAGCGAAVLAEAVESYTGIDMNLGVLDDNNRMYGAGPRWIHSDWLSLDPTTLCADLFLAASLIEHCRSYEAFLGHVLQIPSLKYAIVTFHKGLRDKSIMRTKKWERDGKRGKWPDNYYCFADVHQWLLDNVSNAHWRIYTLEHSYDWSPKRWDSVLVFDWTRNAQLDMWEIQHVSC